MNKKLLVLLGYASGVVIALLYNKKNPEKIKAELTDASKNEDNNLKVLFNNFIEIHKNLLDDLKTKILTEENKAKFYEKKDEFLRLIEEYKVEGKKLLQEYKGKGKEYSEEGIKKLEIFCKEKLEKLEELKEDAPEKFKKVREKLLSYLKEFKDKIKK